MKGLRKNDTIEFRGGNLRYVGYITNIGCTSVAFVHVQDVTLQHAIASVHVCVSIVTDLKHPTFHMVSVIMQKTLDIESINGTTAIKTEVSTEGSHSVEVPRLDFAGRRCVVLVPSALVKPSEQPVRKRMLAPRYEVLTQFLDHVVFEL